MRECEEKDSPTDLHAVEHRAYGFEERCRSCNGTKAVSRDRVALVEARFIVK